MFSLYTLQSYLPLMLTDYSRFCLENKITAEIYLQLIHNSVLLLCCLRGKGDVSEPLLALISTG